LKLGRTAWQACNAVVIAGDSSAIDDAGARAKAGQRFDDQWEAAGEVIARRSPSTCKRQGRSASR